MNYMKNFLGTSIKIWMKINFPANFILILNSQENSEVIHTKVQIEFS